MKHLSFLLIACGILFPVFSFGINVDKTADPNCGSGCVDTHSAQKVADYKNIQCATDICGPAEENLTVNKLRDKTVFDPTAVTQRSAEFDQNLKDDISQLMDLADKRKKKQVSHLNQLLKDPLPMPFELSPLVNLILATQASSTGADKEIRAKLLKDLETSPEGKDLGKLNDFGSEAYFNIRFTHPLAGNDPDIVLNLDAARVSGELRKLESIPRFGPLITEYIEERFPKIGLLLTKLHDGEGLSPKELGEYLTSSRVILLGSAIYLRPNEFQSFYKTRPPKINDFIEDHHLKDKMKTYQEKLANEANLNQLKSAVMKKCQGAYAEAVQLAPTAEELEKAKDLVNEAKKNISKKILPLFSEHSRHVLQDVMDHLKVIYPPSAKATQARIRSELKNFREHGTKLTSNEEILDQLNIYRTSNFEFDSHLSSLAEMCDSFTSGNRFEQFLQDKSSYPYLVISSYSIKNPKLGQGIIAHEIAHALSKKGFQGGDISQVSKGKYLDIMSCLEKNHPKKGSIFQVLKSDLREEDWADLVSTSSPGNYGCAFLDTSGGNQKNQYSNLTLTPKDKDPHSSDFFRAIHLHQVIYGKLPASCEQIDSAPRFKEPSCLEAGKKRDSRDSDDRDDRSDRYRRSDRYDRDQDRYDDYPGSRYDRRRDYRDGRRSRRDYEPWYYPNYESDFRDSYFGDRRPYAPFRYDSRYSYQWRSSYPYESRYDYDYYSYYRGYPQQGPQYPGNPYFNMNGYMRPPFSGYGMPGYNYPGFFGSPGFSPYNMMPYGYH